MALKLPLEVVLTLVFSAHLYIFASISHNMNKGNSHMVVPAFKHENIFIYVHVQNGYFRGKLLRVLCNYLGRGKHFLGLGVFVLNFYSKKRVG